MPVRVLELGLERERPRVRLPAGHRRLESLDQIRTHVQPARTRPAAEPLDRAADGEVDVERGDVERHAAGGLVRVEHDVRTRGVRGGDDPLDVLDLRRLEEHVLHGHEQRPLVDRGHDVVRRDDLEVVPCLVDVAHAREVLALVDDAVAHARPLKAREDDRLGDRHVLVHADGAGRRADDPPDLVAHGERRRPPALAPRADAALRPRPRVLRDAVFHGRRHRAERVVDQVRRVLEDREAVAVREQIRHRRMNSRMTATASSG